MERPDHRVKNFGGFLLFLVLALSAPLVWCQPRAAVKASVAYCHKGVLYLVSESGQVLQSIPTRPPVGVFAVSPNAQSVVLASLKPEEYGGSLYLLTIPSSQTSLLTHGPYFNKRPNPSGPEVYADPDFSPDGKRIVFAIRGQATGDIVEASGPLAIMDIGSRRVRILQGTLNANGVGGVAFANSPHWSPDGRRLLVNFEATPAVTDVTGKALKNLDSMIPNPDGSAVYAFGWVGTRCVLYDLGKTTEDTRTARVRILNLDTGKTAPADSLIPPGLQTGMVAFSPRLVVRTDSTGQLVVEGTRDQIKPWTIPGDEKTTFVQVLASPEDIEWVPESCR